jgi:hypothetical protein
LVAAAASESLRAILGNHESCYLTDDTRQFKKLAALGKKKAEDSQDVSTRPGTSAPSGVSRVESSASLLPQPARATTASSRRSSSKSDVAESGPLGISVVYTPDHGHKVDIVFIHGLGGTSRYTWSKNKNLELFWPLTFLPLEPDICLARIMTFGYNASFQKSGNVSTSVLDFAKGLLFDLKYGKDQHLEELNVGKVS